jgi:UrcA family protein
MKFIAMHRKALILAMSAFAAADAMAAEHSKIVSLADLDLSTPAGLSLARERIHQSARKLCEQVSDPLDLSRQSNYVACVDESVTQAMAHITGVTPTLVAQSQSAARKPH